jgi:hypothetical protein
MGCFGVPRVQGSVEFGFGLLSVLREVMVAHITYMSHERPWLTKVIFRDVGCCWSLKRDIGNLRDLRNIIRSLSICRLCRTFRRYCFW